MQLFDKQIPQWAIDKYGEERLSNESKAFDGSGLREKLKKIVASGEQIPDVGSALLHAIGLQPEPAQLAEVAYDDSLPDVDADFPDAKRHLVFSYMAEKYGERHTAHIGTISKFKPKSALIQVCKRLGIPAGATASVKMAMIERSIADSRANNCLEDTLTGTEPGKKLVQMYPQVVVASKLEGHTHHTGVHAAGLLVANVPLEHYCTVTDAGIAQVEKGAAERLGLLKIDVLGLRTLGILEDSGIKADWYNLNTQDDETLRVFNENRMCGIFQFEGEAMRLISAQIKFKSIVEVDAITALARPGPLGGGVTKEWLERYNGKPYAELHPLVQQAMAETYGLPLYQEQTLAIVKEIGNFSWEETSIIRKAVSKRLGVEFFDSMFQRFAKGAAMNGLTHDEALKTWHLINAMGAWQMNKAHTRSYAVISLWTAWLKAHHPLEFAAANLRNAKDDDQAINLLREMVREGLEYVPFDWQLSTATWSVQPNSSGARCLVAGLDALKGFGPSKAGKFVAARDAGKLTDKMIEQAKAAENKFADIFPINTKFGHIYRDPEGNNITGRLREIRDIDTSADGTYVYIGRLINKNLRDVNEDVNVKKRGGKVLSGPRSMMDIKVQDDSGIMPCRVDRFKFAKMGRELQEEVPLGAVLLIRARFAEGIRFGFIEKWKRLA